MTVPDEEIASRVKDRGLNKAEQAVINGRLQYGTRRNNKREDTVLFDTVLYCTDFWFWRRRCHAIYNE